MLTDKLQTSTIAQQRMLISACMAIFVLAAGSLPAQDEAMQRLNDSPRHHEWVKVKVNDVEVESFLVFPEVKEKATAVVVIHENRGLTDWVRSVADQLAEAGYIAIAPDLLTGKAPNGGKTSDFKDNDAARDALYQLSPDEVTARLLAVSNYVTKLPACNRKLVVAGFCWGGQQAFKFSTNKPGLTSAFVFYGTPPDSTELQNVRCPVYGFYGGDDARVNQTVPRTTDLMKAAGKVYEPVTYENAHHAFMRRGELSTDPQDPDKKARDEAWARWLELLKKI